MRDHQGDARLQLKWGVKRTDLIGVHTQLLQGLRLCCVAISLHQKRDRRFRAGKLMETPDFAKTVAAALALQMASWHHRFTMRLTTETPSAPPVFPE